MAVGSPGNRGAEKFKYFQQQGYIIIFKIRGISCGRLRKWMIFNSIPKGL